MTFDPGVPVVLLASSAWESPAKLNVHHVATRLAERGHRVLFVESTGLRAPAARSGHDWQRVTRRLRDFAGGVRRVAPNLDVLSPLALPGSGPGWLRAASQAALRLQLSRALRRSGIESAVLWAFLPTAAPLLSAAWVRLGVYHCVDHYAANPGVDAGRIEALEARMLGGADLVFATSAVLGERLRRHRSDVRVVPNVADTALFARALDANVPEPEGLAGRPRPRLLFAGNLAAYRVDLALLTGLARRRPDLQLVLLGPRGLGDVEGAGAEEAALLAEPNVLALDAVAHERLPDYMAHCDVGLIPFLRNPHTEGSMPLKLFEYLGAGLPVVATELPNLVPHAEPGVLSLAADGGGFEAAVDAALAAPEAARARRLEVARTHDWEARMDELCAAVEDALLRRAARASL
ncbi:MAG: glycosyltransferase [Myxococcota bacterium]|nr:glycosyltransferase [Myxococcota bacterium]